MRELNVCEDKRVGDAFRSLPDLKLPSDWFDSPVGLKLKAFMEWEAKQILQKRLGECPQEDMFEVVEEDGQLYLDLKDHEATGYYLRRFPDYALVAKHRDFVDFPFPDGQYVRLEFFRVVTHIPSIWGFYIWASDALGKRHCLPHDFYWEGKRSLADIEYAMRNMRRVEG